VLDKRLHPRFSCEREVEVAYFRHGKRCAVQKAVVCDISKGGLRLRLPEPAPACDRVLVRTGNMVISYVIRSRTQENGIHYAGAETITEVSA
jgi:hypothetical protein